MSFFGFSPYQPITFLFKYSDFLYSYISLTFYIKHSENKKNLYKHPPSPFTIPIRHSSVSRRAASPPLPSLAMPARRRARAPLSPPRWQGHKSRRRGVDRDNGNGSTLYNDLDDGSAESGGWGCEIAGTGAD